jgi:hypothetical protein
MTGRIELPTFARSVGRLSASQVVLDGELVAVRPDGVTTFPTLQAALRWARSDRRDVYNTTTLSCGCSSTDRAVNLTIEVTAMQGRRIALSLPRRIIPPGRGIAGDDLRACGAGEPGAALH